jgi:arylsulfatase A-like enzyme
MQRRIRLVILAVALMCAGLGVPRQLPGVGASTDRPNVLMIVTDDQRFDQIAKMPNVRRIFAGGGTNFPKAYATTPLCCPARATLMTGRYAHNHRVTINTGEAVRRLDHSTTVARYLRDAGYRTAMAGKIFNGWSYDKAPPHYDRWAVTRAGYVQATFNDDGQLRTDTGYSTDFISNRAVEFLQAFEQENDANPWFLYLAPFAPHWDYTPAQQDKDAPVAALTASPARQELDRSDKPPVVRRRSASLASVQAAWKGQVRTLMSVDRMVDRVFDLLEASGEQNTLAFFVSDNGYLLAEHGIAEDKQFPYTHAIRVPMLMRWPGHVAAAAVDKRRVSNADIGPTILQAAGVAAPAEPAFDGRSLFTPFTRNETFVEYFAGAELEGPLAPEVPGAWASIVTDQLQYVEWYANDGRTVEFREYYNMVNDPQQLTNLLGDRSSANNPPAAKLAALRDRLARYRDCVGTTGANPCP